MTRAILSSVNASRALRALVAVAALSALACEGNVNFTGPSAPRWPWSEPGVRMLQIHGTLETRDGACREATVLYDGVELVGARSRCPELPGCTRLSVEGSVRSQSGRHTVSFQVLRQSEESVDYVAQGNVLVSREGLALGGVTLPLGPKHASLGAGGAVSFEIELN